MANLFKYTYLNANGYLDKFREALNMPQLTRAQLTKLLKVFYNDYKQRINCDFIVKDDNGNLCLYNKEYLNRMLGMDDSGYKYQNDTIWLRILEDYIAEWDRKTIEKEHPEWFEEKEKEIDPMKAASDELIYNDNYNTEINESKTNGKKIYVNEEQFRQIVKRFLNEERSFDTYDTRKVGIVKNFLDNNFIKSSYQEVGNDGYPFLKPIVTMKTPDGSGKQMSDSQLFYLLQDKYQHIFSDEKMRDDFLKKVMTSWFYGKISNDGIILN